MTSKKTRSRSKRTMKKKFSSKKHPTIKSVNTKIHHLAMKTEVKWADYAWGGTAYDANPYLMGPLNAPYYAGLPQVARTNNWINNSSLQLRIVGKMYAAALNEQSQQLRIIVFWDRQPNAAAPTILGTPSGAAPLDQSLLDTTSLGSDIVIPRNQTTIERYTILYDQTHVFNFTCYDSNNMIPIANTKYIPIFIKLGRKTLFNQTTNVDQRVFNTNALWAVALTGTSSGSGTPMTITGASRVYFKDT